MQIYDKGKERGLSVELLCTILVLWIFDVYERIMALFFIICKPTYL
jgi:hypothetical protein